MRDDPRDRDPPDLGYESNRAAGDQLAPAARSSRPGLTGGFPVPPLGPAEARLKICPQA